jgi:hypothetical protein
MKPIYVKPGVVLLLLTGLGICSCGQQKEPRPVVNSPPAIQSVKIVPENPGGGSELSAIVESQDPDGDVISLRYLWIKNNEEIPLENSQVLKSGNFHKGDSIKVIVTPSDGKTDGSPVSTPPVRIADSPPVVREVWIEPRVAYANDHLEVHTKDFDADGDQVSCTFQWEKNGIAVWGEKTGVLEAGKFKKGDTLVAIAIPDDRETRGIPRRSEAIVIANGPPIIVSSPPATMERANYTYHVKANDPDNDPISFGLKSGPKGMKIDSKTGLIQWELKNEDKGTHPIEIEAADPEGAKSFQRFTLTIDYK